jgi:hypothetical protein
MGTLLTFQPNQHAMRSSAPSPEMGKLLLFTGVRYERAGTTDTQDEKKRTRRVKSRRRT